MTTRSRTIIRESADKTTRRKLRRVKFGDVVVYGEEPDPESVRQSVEQSTEALRALLHAITTPGIKLQEKKGVPLFSAASGEPGVFIRKLDGRTEKGRLVNGEFKPLE